MSNFFVTHNQVPESRSGNDGRQRLSSDARAVAAYEPAAEGNPANIIAIAVFEAFRGKQADLPPWRAGRAP